MSTLDLLNNLTATEGETGKSNSTNDDNQHDAAKPAVSLQGEIQLPWVNRIIKAGNALTLSPIEVDRSNAEAHQAKRDLHDSSIPFDWANSPSGAKNFDPANRPPSLSDNDGLLVYKAIKENLNIVVVGEPGTGKTRFINDCLVNIPAREQLLSIQAEPKITLGLHPTDVGHYLIDAEISADISDDESRADFSGKALYKALSEPLGASRLIIGDADKRALPFMVHAYMSDRVGLIASVEAPVISEAITKLTQGIGNADEVDVVSKLIYSSTDIFILLRNVDGHPVGTVLSPIKRQLQPEGV